MSSLFIDSSTRTDNDYYRIPNKIEFKGVKLRSAIILNNTMNVNGFSINVSVYGGSAVIAIADGDYSGASMASYLENRLNQLVPINGTPWNVTFNQSSNRFSFSFNNISTTNDASLTFNTASQAFFGATNLVFPKNVQSYVEAPFPSITQEAFYRIECPSLSSLGFVEHESVNSGLLAIVPVSGGYGTYSKYENPDNFFLTSISANDLYNYIQIKIFIRDSNTPLVNPQFALTFQFI